MKTTNGISKLSVVAVCALMLNSASLFAAPNTKVREERGTIREVNMNQHQFVITDRKDNAVRRFQWNDKTEFMEHGKKVAPAFLKAGEIARLTYTPGGDVPTAQRVQLAPANTTKHTPTHHSDTRHG